MTPGRCCVVSSLFGHAIVRGLLGGDKQRPPVECSPVSSLPSEPRTMAWRGSTIVLVALCLGLTVRADEYGEADGDATGASDAIGAL